MSKVMLFVVCLFFYNFDREFAINFLCMQMQSVQSFERFIQQYSKSIHSLSIWENSIIHLLIFSRIIL